MKKVFALITLAFIVSGCTTTQSTTPVGTTGEPMRSAITTSATATTTSTPSPNPSNSYTLTQVAQHNSVKDCWMVIDDTVYDVTSYLPNHQDMQIVNGCGKDATVMFDEVRKHSKSETLEILPTLKIGTLTK